MIEIYRNRKPIICPSCGFRPVARIVYGLPKDPEFNEYERKLYDEEEAGRVVFGECMILITNYLKRQNRISGKKNV